MLNTFKELQNPYFLGTKLKPAHSTSAMAIKKPSTFSKDKYPDIILKDSFVESDFL